MVTIQQDPVIGTILDGTYEVLSLIGHGGMGVVYKARHKLMDRVVAIKMLKAQLVSDSMSVKRFQQEVKATGRLVHPHAITVYDFGISPDGLPFIVMDYLEGSSLSEVIKKEDHIAVDRGVRIVIQACEALAHAHKQGVVHRDLKPSNIVLTNYDDDPDFVKVVDFGVAKLVGGAAEGAQRLTQTGEVCGSPVYMSPEQCLGMELDLRSDIYSMGIVIYETLTGKLPLIGRTMVDTMSKHVSEMPLPFTKIRPDIYIPERIEQVVFKAMAKDASKRHQSMDELREDLENAIPKPGRNNTLRNTQTISIRQEPAVAPSNGATKKTIVMIAVACMAVLAGAVALGAMIQSGSQKAPIANVTPLPGIKTESEPKKGEPQTSDTTSDTNSSVKSGSKEGEKVPSEESAGENPKAKTTAATQPEGKLQTTSRPEQTPEHKNPFATKKTIVSAVKEPPTTPERKVQHLPKPRPKVVVAKVHKAPVADSQAQRWAHLGKELDK